MGSVQEMRVDEDSIIAPLRLGFQSPWLFYDFLPTGPVLTKLRSTPD